MSRFCNNSSVFQVTAQPSDDVWRGLNSVIDRTEAQLSHAKHAEENYRKKEEEWKNVQVLHSNPFVKIQCFSVDQASWS